MELFKGSRKKKGTVMLYITFIIASIFIVLIGAVFAPMGILFNVKMFEAGEMILNNSQSEINHIQDAAIRNEINATITSAKAAHLDNIEVLGALYQYSWIFVIILTGLIVFIYTRRLTEYNTGYI